MKENKRAVWSWALYDWANSAYTTTVMAGFFPIFFKEYWADPNNPNQSTFYLGMANSIYAIIVAAIAHLIETMNLHQDNQDHILEMQLNLRFFQKLYQEEANHKKYLH